MNKLFCFCFVSVLSYVSGAGTTQGPNTNVSSEAPPPTSTPAAVTTKTSQPISTTPALSPAEQCQQANSSCDACVKVGKVQCVWCNSKKQCLLKNKLIPTDECGLADAKWAVCWLNYEALIIAVSVIGGLLILGLTICICCCCCCRKGNKEKWAREDAKLARQNNERKARNADKRAERKAKTDEIRRKYGLIKDDTPYTRFNDEA